jgi:hypothetical protein
MQSLKKRRYRHNLYANDSSNSFCHVGLRENWSDSFGCFGGFAPHELAIRIDDCKPRAIITASSGIEVDLIAYKPLWIAIAFTTDQKK